MTRLTGCTWLADPDLPCLALLISGSHSTTCAYDAHENVTSDNQPASKRPTNLTLDVDLGRQTQPLISNFCDTVEDLLHDFLAREQGRRVEKDAAVTALIDGLNAFHQKNCLLSDEFSSL